MTPLHCWNCHNPLSLDGTSGYCSCFSDCAYCLDPCDQECPEEGDVMSIPFIRDGDKIYGSMKKCALCGQYINDKPHRTGVCATGPWIEHLDCENTE